MISLVLLAVLLAACDSGAATSSAPAAGTPAAAAAQATNTGRAPGAASNLPVAAATKAAGASASASAPLNAPTAVPAPVIVIPTPLAPATPTNTSVGAIRESPTATTKTSVGPTQELPAAAVPSLASLRGKIAFFSDRDGYPQLYVMNADGSNQQPCNCSDLLQTMVARETTSPDGNQFLFYRVVGGGRGGDQQIWAHNNTNGWEAVVTGAAPGFPGVDYDAVWSPDSKYIAFVTEINGFDEIYLYDSNEGSTVRLTQSASEWYKAPTFSTDGSRIAYWTNFGNVLQKQIWVMKLDGSGKTNISNNAYNDWDPIWVK